MTIRLLFLNWRDPWHPKAGGAEVFAVRMLERLAARGYDVTWFSAMYPGAAVENEALGIRFVRGGSQLTVHALAFARYRRSDAYDLVVDCINTIPFFTPFYRAPHLALMYQLAREVWFHEAGGVIGAVGFAVEPLYLQAYRRSAIVTISRSSAQSFAAFGLPQAAILPIATDEVPDDVPTRKPEPRDLLYVGRIARSKRIVFAVRAAARLAAGGWGGRLRIVGGGDAAYRDELAALAAELGIGDRVTFTGFVDRATRTELMREASVLLVTSAREGWGLVVTEAAAHGTPSVVFDVPGLRDAVSDGTTGMVTAETAEALARGVETVFARFDRFSAAALASTRPFSWDATTDAFERLVSERLRLRTRPSR